VGVNPENPYGDQPGPANEPGQPGWQGQYGNPIPPKKSRKGAWWAAGIAVVAVLAILLFLWPGWLISKDSSPNSGPGGQVAVDQSTPEATAKSVVGLLNAGDVKSFVSQTVCADGQVKADDGVALRAEEQLYQGVPTFDPQELQSVRNAKATFSLDTVRDAKPSDPDYQAGSQVAQLSVKFSNVDPRDKEKLADQVGILTLFNDNNKWVVCQMGFVPADEVPGSIPQDPDVNSPTGRAQGFIAAINAGIGPSAKTYLCPNSTFTADSINKLMQSNAQLELGGKVEPPTVGNTNNAQLKIWKTVNGQQTRMGGLMQKDPKIGWCILALGETTGGK